ncbi:hypothetical protein C2742_01655 [Polynucleobacter paneuropaeus]|uniref:hypothetical protein n=1 Tax=Polynucleobacter paneuropaeus TaxID=2527775 RepID=UPI001BFD54E0|nr:hypothetical protein [Polynucleobacter paneuropaeus]QWD48031.1 hypothetical protein G6658_01660 [Polynucleobacter paneuropaeus]QWD52907.1 hypothetical protein C2752_01655 [Polynucleobacter paneuropaeus]QWD57821.1 hypothetical protein C2742_01655 [Polynucleobacter paneuropaeus]
MISDGSLSGWGANHRYSVLVNSSDGYEDCWRPFFHLLKKYWPMLEVPIYLNTEHKNWKATNYPNLICTQVEKENRGQGRLTWSECLMLALEQIKTPLVLYFQEDYFIHQNVRHVLIEQASDYMVRNPEVSHIALTRHCSYGPYEAHSEPWLQTIGQNARYRISTQAALWRVDVLKSYLNSLENGWMFEVYGTWRANKRKDVFLSAKWDQMTGGPAIDYLHTGIIKGKWLSAIRPVFASNGIEVDFNRRGFYVPKNAYLHKLEVAQKLLKNPRHLLNQIFK